MAKKEDFILSEKIDHKQILFQMMLNMNKAAFVGDDVKFFRGVDTLESNVPKVWEDERYRTELEDAKTNACEEVVMLGKLASDDEKGAIAYQYGQFKYRAIINLFERRGMFGEREIEEVI